MRMWTLYRNGLKSGIPDVMWRFEGEADLYLVMRALYSGSPVIGYSMVRCPHGQIWKAESVLYAEGKTPTEFEQIFHAVYAFPLPEDIGEKYSMMMTSTLG